MTESANRESAATGGRGAAPVCARLASTDHLDGPQICSFDLIY